MKIKIHYITKNMLDKVNSLLYDYYKEKELLQNYFFLIYNKGENT